MSQYELADFNKNFPAMKQAEYDSLLKSMQQYGFWAEEPVVLWRDDEDGKLKIVDGSHRYKAAQQLGIDPEFVVKEGTRAEVREWCYDKNLARRHLTDRKRAALYLQKNPRATKEEIEVNAQVGAQTAQQMRKRANEHPEDIDAVASGNPLPERAPAKMPKQPVKFELPYSQAEASWQAVTQDLGYLSHEKMVSALIKEIIRLVASGGTLTHISVHADTPIGPKAVTLKKR